ncbi:MAG: metallophosphoesterase [Lentisphaeria bacterium]|nr:metallophosphoesterase [Lentisphaeria bacterium]
MYKKLFVFALLSLSLAALTGETPNAYRLLVLGDLHYTSRSYHPQDHPKKQKSINKYINMWKSDSPELLAAAKRQALREKVDGVLQLGDLIDGGCSTMSLQEKMLHDAFLELKKYFPKLPIYTVIGNHDVRLRNGDSIEPVRRVLFPMQAAELGKKMLGNGNYTFRRGPDLFVALDYFSPEEKSLDFLRQALAEHSKTRYVFLLTHYPLFPAAYHNPLCLVPYYMKIAALLEKRRGIVLTAHTHVFSRVTRTTAGGRVSQMCFTSMGVDWHNNHLLRKLFGNPLTEECNWESYLKIARKGMADSKHAAILLEDLYGLEISGKFTGEFFVRKSGFAILEVTDRAVQVKLFVDDSGIPAKILNL